MFANDPLRVLKDRLWRPWPRDRALLTPLPPPGLPPSRPLLGRLTLTATLLGSGRQAERSGPFLPFLGERFWPRKDLALMPRQLAAGPLLFLHSGVAMAQGT